MYSFFTAEVKKIRSEEIAWARAKLGIDDKAASDMDVIKAYRRKANLCHPDRNTGDPDADEQFNEICRAHKLLLECFQGNDNSSGEQEYARDVIIVKMKG